MGRGEAAEEGKGMLRKILIVDDDDLTARLLSSRLKEAGYEIITAQTGEGALQKMTSARPDAVIMDIMLPDMQGSDVVGHFQDQPDSHDIKVIFLSGIISQADAEIQQIRIGDKFYPAIGKPVDFKQLLELLSAAEKVSP